IIGNLFLICQCRISWKFKGGQINMKKWLGGIMLSVALIFVLAACSSDNNDANADDPADSDRLDELKEDGAIIGFADEKPYAYKEDGEIKGVAVDVETKVLKELGRDEVINQMIEFKKLNMGI